MPETLTRVSWDASLFNQFFCESPVGLNLCTLNGVWLESNPAFLKTIGYTEDTAKGLTYWDLTPRKYDVDESIQLKRLEQEGVYGPYEKEFIRKDGSLVPVRLNGFIIEQKGQKYIWSSIEDLSSMKKLEEENVQLTEEISRVYSLSPVLTSQIQMTQKGEITMPFLVPSGLRIFDLDYIEYLKNPLVVLNMIHPEDRQTLVAALHRSAESLENPEWSGRFVTSSGKIIWLLHRATPQQINDEAILWTCTAVDITKEKMAQVESIKRKKILRVVLENVPAIIYAKDCRDEFRYTLLNRPGEYFFGMKDSQFIGKTDFDVFPLEIAELIRLSDRDLLTSLKSRTVDQFSFEHQGKNLTIRMTQVLTKDEDGGIDRIIVLVDDLTEELKQQEALLASKRQSERNAHLAAVGEISASIAHEINNPLTVITGSLNMIDRDCSFDDPSLKSKLATIKRSTDRISKIIKSLLKFSRPGAQKGHFPASVETLITEALALVEMKAKKNFVEIRFEKASSSFIMCDEIEIGQVFINLVSNAIDAAKDSSKRLVEIQVEPFEEKVIIRILDSGSGISFENEEKIFQPFFTTKPVGEGTGLGLPIVMGIVKSHGGRITLNRKFDRTCFEVEFPKVLGSIVDNKVS